MSSIPDNARACAARNHHWLPALFTLSLLTGLMVFWPGLHGPFLLYDEANLHTLGRQGGIGDWRALLEFALSGEAGPLGRPLTLLSFALNGQTWPTDPWPFKYTNLLIHLLNGVLVFVLASQLGGLAGGDKRRVQMLAFAAMTLWLVHPMHLSTIMLVAQRMTELSALFTLAGLILYVHGRRLAIGRPLRGYACLSAGIGAGGLLAVLSKENGVLLPLYALVIEATLIRAAALPRPIYWRAWLSAFLILPLALLLSHLLMTWWGVGRGFEAREFTQLERLLTETRVLIDYLRHIFIPRIAGAGLFHDDYAASTGLFNPVSTLACTIVLSALAVVAAATRRRQPVLSFAILWFFAGHALESTFVPLELYFEHRNYLPMLGPLFALGYYLLAARGTMPRLAPAALGSYIVLELCLTLSASPVWGNYALAAHVWALEKPRSVRAQQMAADYWVSQGDYDRAVPYLRRAGALNPRALGVQLQGLRIECLNGSLTRRAVRATLRRIPDGIHEHAELDAIKTLRALAAQPTCAQFTSGDLHALIDAYLRNPGYRHNGNSRARLYYEKALLYASQGLLPAAIESMRDAYAARPKADYALHVATWLASAGSYQEALEYVEIAKRSKARRPFAAVSLKREILQLEQSILSHTSGPGALTGSLLTAD
ncbi:MAG: tetratricopeptide repeat protein [Gammaproteobacteria bacterium]